MNEELTFAKFRHLNDARNRHYFKDCEGWTPSDWACSLAGEVGETCNLVKKLKRMLDEEPEERGLYDTRPSPEIEARLLIEKIGKELADVVTCADLLARKLDLNLEICVREKFNEVSDRVNCGIKL